MVKYKGERVRTDLVSTDKDCLAFEGQCVVLVDDIVIALGISEEGIDFDSFDHVPVHLLFVITNPPEKQMEYLVALSTVSRLVRDEAFRESLRATVPAREIELKICQAFSECLKKYGKLSN